MQQLKLCLVAASDCNPRIEFLIPRSGIEKFVIPESRVGIRLTDTVIILVSLINLFYAQNVAGPMEGILELYRVTL